MPGGAVQVRIDVLTLFPGMFGTPFAEGIVRKAVEDGLVDLRTHPLRHWAEGRHAVTDDYVFGGGPGMVLRAEPVFAAVRQLQSEGAGRLILLTPQGRRFDQAVAERLAGEEGLLFLCGRYEGIDERVRLAFRPEELSLGDFVLSGGEIAAMAVIDAVVRLVPGVLEAEAVAAESFSTGLLEGPHYTRPRVLEGLAVPEVLLSGDHAAIRRWRRREALRRTWRNRPELLAGAALTAADRVLLSEVIFEESQRSREGEG